MIKNKNHLIINGKVAFPASVLREQGYDSDVHPAALSNILDEFNTEKVKQSAIDAERRESGYDLKYSDEQVVDALRLAVTRHQMQYDAKTGVVLTPDEITAQVGESPAPPAQVH